MTTTHERLTTLEEKMDALDHEHARLLHTLEENREAGNRARDEAIHLATELIEEDGLDALAVPLVARALMYVMTYRENSDQIELFGAASTAVASLNAPGVTFSLNCESTLRMTLRVVLSHANATVKFPSRFADIFAAITGAEPQFCLIISQETEEGGALPLGVVTHVHSAYEVFSRLLPGVVSENSLEKAILRITDASGGPDAIKPMFGERVLDHRN